MKQGYFPGYDKPKKTEVIESGGIKSLLVRGGYIKLETGKLRVQLKRFMNPEIDYAARHICEDLNRMNPVTLDKYRLPIHYGVL